LAQPAIGQERNLYTVQRGDFLIKILAGLGLRPIYGKDGKLAEVVSLNPRLKKSQGNLIFPGQKIILSPSAPVTEPVAETMAPIEEKTVEEEIKEEAAPVVQAAPVTDEDLASLSILGGTGFIRSQASDTTGINGTTDTKSYYFTHLSFRQYWNKLKLITDFQFGLHSIKLSPPPSEDHSKDSFTIPSYGIRFEKAIKDYGSLFLGVHYDPIFYAYSRTGQVLNIGTAQLGTISFGGVKEVLNYKTMSSHLRLGALGIIPQKNSHIKFNSGLGYEAGIHNKYRFQNWSVDADLFYKNKFLETNLGKIDQSELGLGLGLTRYLQ